MCITCVYAYIYIYTCIYIYIYTHIYSCRSPSSTGSSPPTRRVARACRPREGGLYYHMVFYTMTEHRTISIL